MYRAWAFVFTGWLLICSFSGQTQRVYAPHSVLATGNWYKLAVRDPGIYKIDLPFLSSLGISTGNLSTATVRLFGRTGSMLPESNAAAYQDDLTEIALYPVDGGDGILNGGDYLLFYAPGPDQWVTDTLSGEFSHQKNRYSNQAFYFISTGGVGKRVNTAPVQVLATTPVTSFTERYFHELDTVNFLAGGKEWYGEEFANAPGKTLSRNFTLPFSGILPGTTITLKTNCAGRSVGAPSRFDIRIDNQPLAQLTINPVNAGTYDPVAQPGYITAGSIAASASPQVSYTFIPGSFNSQGWLNWLEVTATRSLAMNGAAQLLFRDRSSTGNDRLEFSISGANGTTGVWDITDPLTPVRMPGQLTGSDYKFINQGIRLREYVAFNTSGLYIPSALGKINNQDLHGGTAADYIIVTHASLLNAAERVAAFHRRENSLRTIVVTTDQVYNEFAAGQPDPVAIRDFVKMYYDRFGASAADKPRYLLLFGDASYDYKDRLTGNTNLVPAWQSEQSLDPLSTYTADDFFGFLDTQEDINAGNLINLLDIGIGRIPARNSEEAGRFADKLEAYHARESKGPWRTMLCFVADDEDGNLHLQDAELISATAMSAAPVMNQQKIYLDAYKQESGAGGSQYPGANLAVTNQVYNGTLIFNYNGHGGAARLAEETILDQSVINGFANQYKLPLFITATCDFAPFDHPGVASIGENLLLRPATGAIALMTTTRPVFAFSNRIMNNNYMRFALEQVNGRYRSLGDAVREAKNYTYQTMPDIANNRKFVLLGDPAMTLAFPALQVRPTLINTVPAAQTDTLSAGESVTIQGEVTDKQGVLQAGYNGTVYATIYDKPRTITTLGNDPGSQPVPFSLQQNSLFRGQFSIQSGHFQVKFTVPRDINFSYGNGRLSLYAANDSTDGQGVYTGFVVGGISTAANADKEGPGIRAWLNDERFVNGGLTNQRSLLLLRLSDSSGINTTGLGIGHDLVATLDGDNNRYYILNDFYEAEANNYQQGMVRFQLPELSPGPHQLTIKAWDVMNNSSERVIDFIVADDGEFEIRHVLNYPNPFTTHTSFWFEHNKPGMTLQVQVQLMTITGRVVRRITGQVDPGGSRVTEISWDGKDDYGNLLAKGVYLYKLRVLAPGKKAREVVGKLYKL